jgi:hypothetical protein
MDYELGKFKGLTFQTDDPRYYDNFTVLEYKSGNDYVIWANGQYGLLTKEWIKHHGYLFKLDVMSKKRLDFRLELDKIIDGD